MPSDSPPFSGATGPNGVPAPFSAGAPLHEGAALGEYIELPALENEVVILDAPDGGAFVMMPGERDETTPPDGGFYENLCAVLPTAVQSKILADLMPRIEEDKETRKKRDEQYEEGIKRTGLGKDAPGGADFEGASRAVHPMITEACVDYESRVIKELFPINGSVVNPRLIGEPTKEKTAQAKRVAAHMDWQLRTQIKEARATLEVTLTQVPLGGSQFIRQCWDHRLKRPRWDFAPVDKIFIPYNAADFASASRKTYAETVSRSELDLRVSSGMYFDLKLGSTGMQPEETRSEKASRKVEGAEDPGANLDGSREIYETSALILITEELADALGAPESRREIVGELYPFLISIDVSSRQMLAVYRDWEDGDSAREPIDHLFEFTFLPWRGALGVGIPHIAGGLSAAATGALRALLDSALINNSAGGLILKGSGSSGSTPRPAVGELTEIDRSLETDDIRKMVMPFPASPPSPVLFQLLGFVVQAAEGIVRTSLDDQPQAQTPTPVGTQMSRVEEGLVVFSAVHARAHIAFDRLLRGLHRLNRLYLPETLKVDQDGREILVRRRDYDGPCTAQPVSDPTIYSDQQRFAQLNYLHARSQALPALWNLRELELAGLRLIKWPDPESLLITPPAPVERNAVAENVEMALGRPVAAFPAQDHISHLQVLIDFMSSPVLGANPLLAPVFLPAALRHACEHVVHLYGVTMMETVERAAGVNDASELLSEDETVKRRFDMLLAQASANVVQTIAQQVSPGASVVKNAMMLLEQIAPKPQPDPAMAAVQAAAAETARKSAADQAGQQAALLKAATQVQTAEIGAGARIVAAELQAKAALDPRAAAEAGLNGGAAPGAPSQNTEDEADTETASPALAPGATLTPGEATPGLLPPAAQEPNIATQGTQEPPSWPSPTQPPPG